MALAGTERETQGASGTSPALPRVSGAKGTVKVKMVPDQQETLRTLLEELLLEVACVECGQGLGKEV